MRHCWSHGLMHDRQLQESATSAGCRLLATQTTPYHYNYRSYIKSFMKNKIQLK